MGDRGLQREILLADGGGHSMADYGAPLSHGDWTALDGALRGLFAGG